MAQMLTLTGNNLSNDLNIKLSNLFTVNAQYVIKVWVRLGTATNFNIVVNSSNMWPWGGQSFSSSDGLNTSTYTQISYSFNSYENYIYLFVGNTIKDIHKSGLTPQTAGTVYTYGWQIYEMKPTTPAPTTLIPTTPAPTTLIPTTPAPTTPIPTTPIPTTPIPTTTTPIPTTPVPTTPAPTTPAPTTPIPTKPNILPIQSISISGSETYNIDGSNNPAPNCVWNQPGMQLFWQAAGKINSIFRFGTIINNNKQYIDKQINTISNEWDNPMATVCFTQPFSGPLIIDRFDTENKVWYNVYNKELKDNSAIATGPLMRNLNPLNTSAPTTPVPTTPAPTIPPKYNRNNFVVWTNTGTDLPGMPINGTENECETQCDNNPLCLGFSWASGTDTSVKSSCWLKQNINNKDYNQGSYVTYVKPIITPVPTTPAPTTPTPTTPIPTTPTIKSIYIYKNDKLPGLRHIYYGTDYSGATELVPGTNQIGYYIGAGGTSSCIIPNTDKLPPGKYVLLFYLRFAADAYENRKFKIWFGDAYYETQTKSSTYILVTLIGSFTSVPLGITFEYYNYKDGFYTYGWNIMSYDDYLLTTPIPTTPAPTTPAPTTPAPTTPAPTTPIPTTPKPTTPIPTIPPKYAKNNFIVWTNTGTDIPGTPMNGTEKDCETQCDNNPLCLGFSWPSATDTSVKADCWLKKNIDNKEYNNPGFVTYIKPTPAPTTPAPTIPPKYAKNNFIVWTNTGTDIPGTPMNGTEKDCETQCDNNPLCLGFSWPSATDTSVKADCWLKKNIDNKEYNNPGFVTYIKPTPAPTTPAPTIPPKYAKNNFIVWTNTGTDIPGTPMNGTEKDCETQCDNNPLCLGFSWPSATDTSVKADCWLKKNIDNKEYNNPGFVTYIKPTPAPTTPAPTIPPKYAKNNFIVWTNTGTDIPGTPMNGTEKDCETQCDNNPLCLGFSWPSATDTSVKADCWLKKNIDNKEYNNPGFVTYIKPTPPPTTPQNNTQQCSIM